MPRRPSGPARVLAAAAALTVLLLLPSAAPAATARVSGAQLQFVAGATEANAVTFERTASAFRVFDAGADLTAGAGCSQVTDNVASCPHAAVTSIRATLGDRDDSAAVEGSTPAELLGQQGTDILFGSTGADTLDAGPGFADFLGGREGDDTLLALDARSFVKLDGGPGDDTLRGNDAPGDTTFAFANIGPYAFFGMPGFAGGEGNDTIIGSNTDDALFGGPGADTMSGGTGGRDLAFYHDRSENLTVNLANGGATDGGPSDNGVVDGTARRDSITGAEGIVGGTGVDTLTGSATADQIIGGFGGDTVNGGSGGDALCGEGGGSVFLEPESGGGAFVGCFTSTPAGNDVLNGGTGDDTLNGGLGADRMNGGDDVDSVSYGDRTAAVRASILDTCGTEPCAKSNDGQVDVDPLTAGNQGERDTVGLDVEQLGGGSLDDVLSGSARANRLEGHGGDDDLFGGDGDDVLCGDSTTFFVGAIARDVGCFESGVPPGDDVLDGQGGDDLLAGNRGRDMLNGGADKDTVSYQERSAALDVTIEDTCSGAPCAKNNDGQVDVDPATVGNQGERDRVALDVENLIGGAGTDTLAGSNGANIISGAQDTDTLRGLGGSDVLEPNGGVGDVIDGGANRDFVSYRYEMTGVNVSIDNVANDGGGFASTTFPFNQNVRPNVEGILGSFHGDNLSGPAAAARNTLLGYGGGDTLSGFASDDTLDGGSGPDIVRGGTGNDLLSMADRAGDFVVDCDDGAAGGGGTSDRVVFDSGLDTPANCETQSPVSIAAMAGSGAGSHAAMERDLARQHRLAKRPPKAVRKALRRAARVARRSGT